jgi:acetyl esterase/lipase
VKQSVALFVSFWAFLSGSAMAADAPSIGESIAQNTDVGAAVQSVGADSFAKASVPFADHVTGYPELTYATLPGYRPLKLDLFVPAGNGARPLVIYVHGGGWMAGGPRRSAAYSDWPKVLAALSAKGYVVASVGYRFSGEAPFPAAIQDVKAGIRWLHANAAKYGIDPARTAIWGQSAGGHLAALAGVSCHVAALAPDARTVPAQGNVETVASTVAGADEASDCVQAVVAWFGIYDFSTLKALPTAQPLAFDATAQFLGCGGKPCDLARQRGASPISYVDRSDPPFLLIHGTDDQTVPVEQTEQFDAALKKTGVPVTKIIVPAVGHSWIGKTPDSTRSVSREALKVSIDFIDKAIGHPK